MKKFTLRVLLKKISQEDRNFFDTSHRFLVKKKKRAFSQEIDYAGNFFVIPILTALKFTAHQCFLLQRFSEFKGMIQSLNIEFKHSGLNVHYL